MQQESLEDWLKSQIARGCTLESMIDAMQSAGYTQSNARSMVTKAFDEADPSANKSSIHSQTIAAWQNIANNRQQNPSIKPVISLNSPRLMVFDRFLSDAECDALVKLSKAKMQDSTVVDPITGQHVKHPERISRGTHLDYQSSKVVIEVERRVTEMFGFALNQQEAIQILHYRVGGEYRPHFDFFPPTDTGSHPAIAQAGQRMATLIMYLNTPAQGGSTDLPNIGLSVTAKKGAAIYFENIDQAGQPDNNTLHAGTPILAGEKWIATKWLRERTLF